MKNCSECNYTFTFKDRLKSTLVRDLKCKNCNSVYRIESSIYRFIYGCIVMLLLSCISNYIRIFLGSSIKVLILFIILIVFDLIPHKFQIYTKIN